MSAVTAASVEEADAAAAEWVEIIEPRTQEHMFANLTTGECVWDPPTGVPVKKTSDNQWWELFDQNTSRFYYYNATSQRTVWHRPTSNDCDIIPLAKLQTLKQNTEVKDPGSKPERIGTTQTVETSLRTANGSSLGFHRSAFPKSKSRTKMTLSSLTQTSPTESPKASRRSYRHQRPRPKASEAIPDPSSHFVRSGGERTTIGPSQAKYYSIPHNRNSNNSEQQQQAQVSRYQHYHQQQLSPLSKQRSLEGENFRIAAQMGGGGGGTNGGGGSSSAASATSPSDSISRSASFMGSRNPQRGDSVPVVEPPPHWRQQRSVESTPQSARKVRMSPTASEDRAREVTSPVEGYCTPMINRKVNNNGKSSHVRSPTNKERMSISELVDTGLNTLDNNDAEDDVNNRQRKISPTAKKPSSSSFASRSAAAPPMPRVRKSKAEHNNGTMERPPTGSKMSPLQQYILEQAKLSGYRFGGPGGGPEGGRDSLVESEAGSDHSGFVLNKHDESDFADDEDDFDEMSKASSLDGDSCSDDRYLSEEPAYNNLDPAWLRSVAATRPSQPPVPAPRQSLQRRPSSPQQHQQQHPSDDVDAFSEEFDIRMRFGGGGGRAATSSMPRPASHQPTSSLQHHHHYHNHHPHQQQHHHHHHHQQQQRHQHSQQHQQHQQNPNFPVPYEVLHPSLQRNTHSYIDPGTTSSTLKGTKAGGAGVGSMLSVSASLHSAISCESDIEKYAQDNLNVQKRGIFRKKMTVKDILSHTKESIRKPLTCLADKASKKEALEVFRLVQIYMGDRRARQGMTINSVAMDIAGRGFTNANLRDELFVQLCKQTTENLSRESLRRGWELMAICLSFFPPSPTFAPALVAYIFRHRDPSLDYPDVGKWPIHVQISHYAGICAKRLERIGEGGRLSPKRPTVEDIDQSRLQIFRPSMFGGTLQEAMDIQRDRYPQRRLPWILTTLADQIVQLNGTRTEGVFRVPADLDEVNSQKCRIDQWETPACVDCHTAASLLKLWLRELYEPLIPDSLYEDCVRIGDDDRSGPEDFDNVIARLPDLHRDVLTFLVRFLQLFASPEVSTVTKMDAANLGTVFSPNCLRCPSRDPTVILENTRKEMGFVKGLIFNMDTADFEGVL